jgi:exodeoxyribonuclease-3
MALTIASVNVNGIRASVRKGFVAWLDERQPDVVTLQEVRAPDEVVHELLNGEIAHHGYHIAHAEAAAKGRAGVAVLSKVAFDQVHLGEAAPLAPDTGRWIEARIPLRVRKNAKRPGHLWVISAYAHTGDETSETKMAEKHAWFQAATQRIEELRATGDHVLLTGDLNVGHTERDIKNWKGNLKSAGFLPEERAHFDHLFDDLGWVDVCRQLAGDCDGPYSWWSFRGRAFDTDTGWRIDYHIADPDLAARAVSSSVDRAPSYAERWSDHAPVVVTYKL